MEILYLGHIWSYQSLYDYIQSYLANIKPYLEYIQPYLRYILRYLAYHSLIWRPVFNI